MTIKKYYIKKGDTEYEIHEFEYKKKGNSSIDTTSLTLSRTYDSVFDIGDDVSIGYHDDTDTFVRDFNGDITSKESNQELTLTIESYAGKIFRTEFITEVHEDKTLEWIVEWLIDTYTDLTYASTATTDITLERFVINTETAGDAIMRILNDLNWQIRVDNDKNFYFEPSGETASSVDLTVGTNAFMQGNWIKNPNRLINSCTIVGDKAKFNTNETFSPIASQTLFTVTYKITGNVRVTVDGTEKVGGQSGSIGTYDYSVDKEQKKIIFESGMAGTESVVIYYEYELPIKITAKNDVSIANYGTFPRKITDTTLKTISDARKFAKKVVSVYGSPTLSGELRVGWSENVDVGETIRIIDSFNSIDESFTIVNLTKKYPDGSNIIFVGTEEIDLLSMDKDLSERIKKLEEKQDNTDILQTYLSFPENIDVVVRPGRRRTRTRDTSTDSIWGLAVWGTDNWDSDYDNELVVTSVTNPNNIMYERFNFDTYEDDETTATWDTSGETCTFTSGQLAQSKSVALNDGTITIATLTSTEESGDFNYGMKVCDSSLLPIAHYKLDDNLATTNVIDSIGSYDGTASANTSTMSTTGKLDNGFAFDGTSAYNVDIPDMLTLTDTEFSTAFWWKVQELGINHTPVCVSFTYGAPGRGFCVRPYGSVYGIYMGDNISTTPRYTFAYDYTSDLDTWSHVAITHSGTTTKLYINGVLEETQTTQAFAGGGTTSNIGKEGTKYTHGVVDDVRIFDSEITQEDVDAIYNDGVGTYFSDSYFETVTSGIAHTFTKSGTDLRWRALESAGSTGEISNIKIEYE